MALKFKPNDVSKLRLERLIAKCYLCLVEINRKSSVCMLVNSYYKFLKFIYFLFFLSLKTLIY